MTSSVSWAHILYIQVFNIRRFQPSSDKACSALSKSPYRAMKRAVLMPKTGYSAPQNRPFRKPGKPISQPVTPDVPVNRTKRECFAFL